MSMSDPKPPEQSTDWLWYEGDTLHFDAPRYAIARGITLDDAVRELHEFMGWVIDAEPAEI